MGKVSHGTSSASSSASEAVFFRNGKVQKRIPNFEATVVDTSDNILVFPSPSDEDEFEFADVIETVSRISSETADVGKNPVRFSTVIVGFIIFLTFSWSIYSLFFSVKQDNTADIDSIAELKTTPDIQQSAATQLEQLSQNLLTNSAWSEDDINVFLEKWNQLSEKEVSAVVKTSWYQVLEFNVKKQINEQQAQLKNNHLALNTNQPLLTLGLVMGILEPNTNSGSTPAINSKYNKLLAELTSELKQADKVSSIATASRESEISLNKKLRDKYASINPAPEKLKQRITANKPAQKSRTNNANSVVNKITKIDIDTIVAQYKDAYIKGNLNTMAELFGASGKGSPEYQKVKTSFDVTFKSTVSRSLNIYDVHTNSNGSTAVIDSKFNASVEFKNGKGTQYTVAKMKLFISKKNDKVTINRVNILDRKVNVVANERRQITSTNGMLKPLDNNIAIPTAAELQDITTQLVTAYETGDLAQFVSIFSNEVKTNDRIDLEGVKADYSELFSSTSDRQMFIQNLKWTNETIGAKGTGDLEVIILSDEGNTVYSMEGKIQIVAQKIDNQVKITHLYHIEREK